jgi:hypothetical protein
VQRGWTLNSDLVLLTSDCLGLHRGAVPFALVSHGTYQDSECRPEAWSPGLLPNYRNCLISCNWTPVTKPSANRIAVEQYGRPQGVSNGYANDLGPSEMPREILDEIIARFLKRVEQAKPQKP